MNEKQQRVAHQLPNRLWFVYFFSFCFFLLGWVFPEGAGGGGWGRMGGRCSFYACKRHDVGEWWQGNQQQVSKSPEQKPSIMSIQNAIHRGRQAGPSAGRIQEEGCICVCHTGVVASICTSPRIQTEKEYLNTETDREY